MTSSCRSRKQRGPWEDQRTTSPPTSLGCADFKGTSDQRTARRQERQQTQQNTHWQSQYSSVTVLRTRCDVTLGVLWLILGTKQCFSLLNHECKTSGFDAAASESNTHGLFSGLNIMLCSQTPTHPHKKRQRYKLCHRKEHRQNKLQFSYKTPCFEWRVHSCSDAWLNRV